jgi:hypothetical protein
MPGCGPKGPNAPSRAPAGSIASLSTQSNMGAIPLGYVRAFDNVSHVPKS